MFKDRADAGRQLADALHPFRSERPLLLGLARGGLPVASAAARALGVEFDALVVRKVATTGKDREFGEGAVAPGGIEVVGEGDRPSKDEFDRAKQEMERRIDAYLDGHPAPNVAGRFVILVDDGLATGVTALAALRYVRTLGPSKVVVAVPTLSEEARDALSTEADGIVFLTMPRPFRAVADTYGSFGETTDQEVATLLGA